MFGMNKNQLRVAVGSVFQAPFGLVSRGQTLFRTTSGWRCQREPVARSGLLLVCTLGLDQASVGTIRNSEDEPTDDPLSVITRLVNY